MIIVWASCSIKIEHDWSQSRLELLDSAIWANSSLLRTLLYFYTEYGTHVFLMILFIYFSTGINIPKSRRKKQFKAVEINRIYDGVDPTHL